MSARTVEELRVLVRAGWRVIALETFEEERALQLLERVVDGTGQQLLPWTVASGLGATGKGGGDLDAGVAAMAAHAKC